jgi:hypothetical protein
MQDVANSFGYIAAGVSLNDVIVETKMVAPYDINMVKDPVLKSTLEKIIASSSQVKSPEVLPADSFMFLSFNGLNNVLQLFIQLLPEKEAQEYNQFKDMVKMMTELDFENDILSLFSDELSVAGTLSNSQVDPVVLINNKPSSLLVLNKLVASLTTKMPGATISEKEINGQKVSIIAMSDMPFPFAFGPVGQFIALGKADTVENTSNNAKDTSKLLSNSDIFKAFIPEIPAKSFFTVYSNFTLLKEAAKLTKASPEQVKNFEDMEKYFSSMLVTVGDEDGKVIVGKLLLKVNKK